LHFFKQFSSNGHAPYTRPIEPVMLDELYNETYEERVFHNQQRLTWDGLKAYYTSSTGALSSDHEQYPIALRALKILYQQYQVDEEIVLDYDTHLVFGLFNKSVPAISLRKSIFFQALRPFAFGFYILVKLNIYFWRGLFSIKERLTKK
ncbi:MAG: methyltransferase, partial [Aureispira sp.]|nr:methyltransferase [Aureispira sp.]